MMGRRRDLIKDREILSGKMTFEQRPKQRETATQILRRTWPGKSTAKRKSPEARMYSQLSRSSRVMGDSNRRGIREPDHI